MPCRFSESYELPSVKSIPHLYFWNAKWLENFVIMDFVLDIPTHLSNIMVADVIDMVTKTWNLTAVYRFLPENIVMSIVGTLISQHNHDDYFSWALSATESSRYPLSTQCSIP